MRRAVIILALLTCLGLTGEVHAQRAKTKKKAAPPPSVSAEMKDFMSFLTGSGDKTDEAIAKHRAKESDVSDMAGGMSVAEPKVLKAEKKDGEDQYTVFVKTGEAKRTYLITWKDKKIQKIKQLSMTLD